MASSTYSRYPQRNRAALALSALLLGLAAPSAAQDLTDSAQRQIAALLSEKASRTPAQAKIDSHLLHAAMVVSGQPLDPALPPLAGEVRAVRADANNVVEVDIRAGVTSDLLAAIVAAGGRVVNAFPEYESVRALLPLTRLESIAARAEVRQIRTADAWSINGALGLTKTAGAAARGQVLRDRLAAFLDLRAMRIPGMIPALNTPMFAAQTNAAQGVDARGDTAHAADTVRANFGFDGTGVRVAVLSDGVDSLSAEYMAGRLPAGVTVVPGQAGSGDEGTAMLEIVHSLAPGASLYFATAMNGPSEMARNIGILAGAPYNCNVIVDDVNYFSEGVFQDSVIAQAVNQVAGNNVLYFSSAGNSGNALNGTSGTWQGDFYDSHTTISPVSAKTSKSVSIHSFDGGITNYNILTSLSAASWSDSRNHTGRYELKWSDPLGRSGNDYDLFILNQAMTQVLDSSTSIQNGNQDPQETISDNSNLTAACRASTPCRVVIAKESTAAIRTLSLDTERGVLALGTNGATYGHNATSGAFSVAATDARAACYTGTGWNHCDPFTLSNVQTWGQQLGEEGGVESYSSDGPRLMYYRSDGSAYTPGLVNLATNGGRTLNKPDLTAADCVPTLVSGFTTFCGTSASAPHAAAVAALMLQAKPGLTAGDVIAPGNMLAVSGGPEWNENSGMGVLMADRFIDTLCAYSAAAPAVSSAGGSYALSIAANPGCKWTVAGSPAWINLSSPSGFGSTSLGFTVQGNYTGSTRTATLVFPGTAIAITQGSQEAPAPLAISTGAMMSGFVTGAYSQTLSATGGAPPYTWSVSSGLPPGVTLNGSTGAISGTPTTAGTYTFTAQVRDSAIPQVTATAQLSIVVISGPAGATLPRAGLISQIAAGASWDSEIWIVNNSALTVPARIKFYGDDGTAGLKDNSLAVPNAPYQVLAQGISSSGSSLPGTLDFVIGPHGTITITTNAATLPFTNGNAQGWAEVQSTSPAITGFCIFRSSALGEGIAPLQTQMGMATLTMPFDNSLATGIAIGNSGPAATVSVAAWDLNGNVLVPAATPLMYKKDTASQNATWPANGHDAFMLSGIPALQGQRGLIQFQMSVGSVVTGVGLRVGNGTFTSVPTTLQ